MPKANVYNMAGQQVGEVELSEGVFGVEPNEPAVHAVVVNHLANCRQGTQSALTRAEVSGGGRKPWRQKGTGHARQGSIRAPQWKGGGVVFAPVPRDYSFRMNRKEKQAALRSALTSRLQDNKLIVLDTISLDEIKTKKMVEMMDNLKLTKALIVTPESDKNVVLSARNIPTVKTTQVGKLNVYDILNNGTVVVTKDAAQKIEEVYA